MSDCASCSRTDSVILMQHNGIEMVATLMNSHCGHHFSVNVSTQGQQRIRVQEACREIESMGFQTVLNTGYSCM